MIAGSWEVIFSRVINFSSFESNIYFVANFGWRDLLDEEESGPAKKGLNPDLDILRREE